MGKWQEEYERQWETYTKDTLRAHFGRQYARYEVTTSDKYELRDLLRTMGSSFDPFIATGATGKPSVNDRARRHNRRSSVRFTTPLAKTREYDVRCRVSSVARAGASEEMDDEAYDCGVPATQVLYTQDGDAFNHPGEDESGSQSDASMQSDVSYVYQTPQPKSASGRNQARRRQRSPAAAVNSMEKLRLPKKRQSSRFSNASNTSTARSSTSTFPAFTPRDLQHSRDQTRLSESMSQTLRHRLASVSPIGRLRFSMGSALDESKTSERDESVVLFAMETQTPNAREDGERGFSLARTPMPKAPFRRQNQGQRDQKKGEEEEKDDEGKTVADQDLDVSMQSMHLNEEDEAMDGGNEDGGADGERKIAAALDFKGMSDDDDDEEEEEKRRVAGKWEKIQQEKHQKNRTPASTAAHPAKPTPRWHWSEATMQGESESPMVDIAVSTTTTRNGGQAQQLDEVIEIDDDDEPPVEPEPEVSFDFDGGGDHRMVEEEDVCAETETGADSRGPEATGARGGDQDASDDPLSKMLRNRLREAGLPLSDDDEEGRAAANGNGVNPFDSSSNMSVDKSTSSPVAAAAIATATASSSPTSSSSSSSTSSKKGAGSNIYYRTKLPLNVEARSTHVDDRRRERRRQKLKKTLANHNHPHSAFREPECRAELAPYQREAVDWMLCREQPANAVEKKDATKSTISNPTPARQREMYYDRLTAKMRGGILADEMGLGKTVCCIALICESLKKVRDEMASSEETSGVEDASIPRLKPPTLIITPLSILGQWEKEIREKTNLSVISYQGHSRRQIQNVMDFMGVDVVLSTYDTLRLKECKVAKEKPSRAVDHGDGQNDDKSGGDDDGDGEESDDVGRLFDQLNDSMQWRTAVRRLSNSKKAVTGSKLHQLTWYRVILDESHLITNPSCARARAALFLKSKRRWCVTGTPIQNSGKDLSSLMTFLGMQSVAPDLDFHEVLSRVMLRRLKTTKDAVSHEPIVRLPEKRDEIVELEFASDVERAFYMILHRSTKRRVFEYLRPHGGGQFAHVFEMLLRLRQCCNACALVSDDPLREVQDSNGALLAQIGTLSRQDAALLKRAGTSPQSHMQSPHSTKITALLTELKKMKQQGERGLVISQWTSYLDLIADAIHEENAKRGMASNTTTTTRETNAERENRTLTFCRLDGRMAAREREQAIASFQVEKRVDILLVSIRTGGLGLNLTAASQVFIMEPSWNPSIESQAIDRAHRVGQKNRVRIVRFLMKNTIEERVVELQRKKRELAAATLGDGAGGNAGGAGGIADSQAVATPPRKPELSRDELRALFSQDNTDDNSHDDDDHDTGAIWDDME